MNHKCSMYHKTKIYCYLQVIAANAELQFQPFTTINYYKYNSDLTHG